MTWAVLKTKLMSCIKPLHLKHHIVKNNLSQDLKVKQQLLNLCRKLFELKQHISVLINHVKLFIIIPCVSDRSSNLFFRNLYTAS